MHIIQDIFKYIYRSIRSITNTIKDIRYKYINQPFRLFGVTEINIYYIYILLVLYLQLIFIGPDKSSGSMFSDHKWSQDRKFNNFSVKHDKSNILYQNNKVKTCPFSKESTPQRGVDSPLFGKAGGESQIRFLHSSPTIYNSKPLDFNPILNVKNKFNGDEFNQDIAFNQWLAGLIDGDGYFHLSEKGSARLNIVMDARDLHALHDIKEKFGGNIYPISKANAFKYQLSNKKELINLINSINGEIRNSKRLLQMNKLCIKYNINLIQPKPLTFYNGWLSGFLDSDGSIYFNENSGQVFISISQLNKDLLNPLIDVYSGKVYSQSLKTGAFKYQIYRKNDLIYLIDHYFTYYSLRTLKLHRLNLIKQFYELRTYKNNPNDLNKLNHWIVF